MKLYENGAYLINGVDLIEDTGDVAQAVAAKTGSAPDKEQAKKGTMAYSILTSHNTSGNDSLALRDKNLGEMTVADGVDTVTDDDIPATATVATYLLHCAVEHRHDRLIAGLQVKAGMAGTLTSKGITAHAVVRGDTDVLQRIGHAHITLYPVASVILPVLTTNCEDGHHQ